MGCARIIRRWVGERRRSIGSRRSAGAWTLLAFAMSLVLMPGLLHACPACAPGDGKTQGLYIVSTATLSLLPLCIVGFGAWFLRRAARLANGGDAARTHAVLDTTTAASGSEPQP